MTDISRSAINHGASVVDSLTTNGSSPAKPVYPSGVIPSHPEEEEDYTIKCICGFHDDDGNTVFCDRCDTWQHTECYYFENGEVLDVSDIEHWCADCKPRQLDVRGAIDRQSMRREQPDLGERKTKKTTTKSHKKKVRPPESSAIVTNGSTLYDKDDQTFLGNPRDYALAGKRPKFNHRYSTSLQSPNLVYAADDRRSGSASRVIQSPSKIAGQHSSNGYFGEPYSQEFLHLYDDDPGDATMQANLFNDITITRSLSMWTQDAEALKEASNHLKPSDVFHRCDQPLDSMVFPFIHKEYKQGHIQDADSRRPQWVFLTTDAPLVKGSILGELKGKIGHMQDYVQDPVNRWDYLRHPVPFVFFHPKLPIYIDTRKEGTRCRYLRRSCRPNLTMTTILENGSDYRFCFVAKHDLQAGSELTIGWTLDQHIREFFRRNSEQVKSEGTTDADEDYVSEWVAKVLADFGGCACDSPSECSLAKYDRRSRMLSNGTVRLSNGDVKARNGYGKRRSPGWDQANHGKSPHMNQHEEGEEDDTGSTSGSCQSKQRSRNSSPIRNATGQNGFGLGLELSDRDKRKIAALEKNFEQIEQDKHQPAPRRKKRNSGGSSVQASMTAASRPHGHVSSFSQANTPDVDSKLRYVDAGTSRRISGSPVGRLPPTSSSLYNKPTSRKKRSSHLPQTPTAFNTLRPNYVSTSVQTEPDDQADWYWVVKSDQPPKPFMSLSKQLLLRSQRNRMRMEQRLQTEAHQRQDPVGPMQASDGNMVVSSEAGEDIEMQDVQSNLSRATTKTTNGSPIQKPRPPDDPGSRTESASTHFKPPLPPQSSNGYRTTDLRVQLPSSMTQAGGDGIAASPRDFGQSPVTVRSPFIQTPSSYSPLFSTSTSNMVQPSPVKKKVSLGEYMSRRSNKAEAPSAGEKPTNSSPILSNSVKPLAALHEAKSDLDQGNQAVETPKREDENPVESNPPI
ncbi:MAG: hypothetical protein L6R38_002748 [Xanthoria sp. 2 TBL-2021]|nr:MAG: hypothetical protein L6R38_002748 [Xanthoria sp. 2 TBL-2021]